MHDARAKYDMKISNSFVQNVHFPLNSLDETSSNADLLRRLGFEQVGMRSRQPVEVACYPSRTSSAPSIASGLLAS